MRNSWDSIPNQSGDYKNPNAARSYDQTQKVNLAKGRAGVFITSASAEIVEKHRYSDTDTALLYKQRVKAMREGDKAATAFLGTFHIVYENPLDRVFRNGEWVEIKELNKAAWREKKQAPKAPRDSAPKNRQKVKSPDNSGNGDKLPPRKRVLHAMTKA